jgi:hypothetical protein
MTITDKLETLGVSMSVGVPEPEGLQELRGVGVTGALS